MSKIISVAILLILASTVLFAVSSFKTYSDAASLSIQYNRSVCSKRKGTVEYIGGVAFCKVGKKSIEIR